MAETSCESENIQVKMSLTGLLTGLCFYCFLHCCVWIEAITVEINTVYIPSVSKQRNLPES